MGESQQFRAKRKRSASPPQGRPRPPPLRSSLNQASTESAASWPQNSFPEPAPPDRLQARHSHWRTSQVVPPYPLPLVSRPDLPPTPVFQEQQNHSQSSALVRVSQPPPLYQAPHGPYSGVPIPAYNYPTSATRFRSAPKPDSIPRVSHPNFSGSLARPYPTLLEIGQARISGVPGPFVVSQSPCSIPVPQLPPAPPSSTKPRIGYIWGSLRNPVPTSLNPSRPTYGVCPVVPGHQYTSPYRNPPPRRAPQPPAVQQPILDWPVPNAVFPRRGPDSYLEYTSGDSLRDFPRRSIHLPLNQNSRLPYTRYFFSKPTAFLPLLNKTLPLSQIKIFASIQFSFHILQCRTIQPPFLLAKSQLAQLSFLVRFSTLQPSWQILIGTVSRVKKIIGLDTDINQCSNNAAFVTTIATVCFLCPSSQQILTFIQEMFIQHLAEQSHNVVKSEKKPRRNIQYKDVCMLPILFCIRSSNKT